MPSVILYSQSNENGFVHPDCFFLFSLRYFHNHLTISFFLSFVIKVFLKDVVSCPDEIRVGCFAVGFLSSRDYRF